jgi:diacylglycerol kinase family enzyme
LGHPKVRYAQGREVTLESSEPTPFHLDGDLAGELPVSVRILPGALRVAVPSN